MLISLLRQFRGEYVEAYVCFVVHRYDIMLKELIIGATLRC